MALKSPLHLQQRGLCQAGPFQRGKKSPAAEILRINAEVAEDRPQCARFQVSAAPIGDGSVLAILRVPPNTVRAVTRSEVFAT
jgi:hypothetical protein